MKSFKEAIEPEKEKKEKIKTRKWTAMHSYLLDHPPGSSTINRLDQYQIYIAFLYAIASVPSELFKEWQNLLMLLQARILHLQFPSPAST